MTHTFCSIIPPTLLVDLTESDDSDVAEAARRSLAIEDTLFAQWVDNMAVLRERRSAAGFLTPDQTEPVQNTVHDMAGSEDERALPGTKVRAKQDPPSSDVAVNEAFDGADATLTFYWEVFARNSIDGQGMDLVSSVHFGQQYDNAFWNGRQMVYGDGGGGAFVVGGLTKALDVIGHELTHGVTEFTAHLIYEAQSGALNESFSDVFGILVKQRAQGIDAASANWLIGEGSLEPALGQGLRHMLRPGTAYRGDRQPADMDHYVDLPVDSNPRNDNGGVHINSGIPNRAFAETAVALGGNAWEDAGRIWYDTLTAGGLGENATFADAAAATIQVAGKLFGENSNQQQAVRGGWEAVKVTPGNGDGGASKA